MKEKINLFFTNKFLFIICIFLFTLFILCTNCFASSLNITFNDYWNYEHSITLSSELENRPYFAIFLFTDDSGYNVIDYVSCDYEFIVHNGSAKSIRVKGYSSNMDILNHTGSEFNLSYIDSSILLSTSSVASFCDSLITMSFSDLTIPTSAVVNGSCIQSGTCIYSNFDLKDSDDNLVFQAPVLDKVTIPGLETVEEIPQAMSQTLRVLIPVGLIVLGIGLIIYLTRLVTSRMQ